MNKNKSILFAILIVVVSCVFTTCRYDKGTPSYGCFPNDVGKIIATKCAVSGCHNDASKEAAGGLSMTSWDNLFAGGSLSACVIPYRHDYSTMCFYINTYPDLGVSLSPTMPYNGTPLTHNEVAIIEKWIDAGAPCVDGSVKFADNPNRKKFYVTDQGCDVVTVFDAATLLPMRYINVGNSPGNELPHNIKVSPDGKYWYVICSNGQYLQKFSTANDVLVGQVSLGAQRLWNTVTISNNGDTAYVVDWESSNDIAVVNLNTFSVTHNFSNGTSGEISYPHGSCMSPDGKTLYITQNAQGSNTMYKIPVSDFSSREEIKLYNGAVSPADTLNSHEVLFSPDGTKYFVTCQQSSDVRVLLTSNDSVIAIIHVGDFPQEMAVSATHNLLFVTCQEDITTTPGLRGSVAIIDLTNNTLIKSIYTGHQPHGIALDDNLNVVMVANRNQTIGGPAPHHTNTGCGGKDGYITFIDMTTLNLVQEGNIPKQVEVAVDPYSVAARH